MRPACIAFKPMIPSQEIASVRLRCYLPIRYLRAAGWDCEAFRPERIPDYDAVVFQKTYSPDDLTLAGDLRARGARVLFDLCDNHLHVPSDRPDLVGRADQLRRMLDVSDLVTVSTPELGKILARPSAVIDDALDEIRPNWDAVGSLRRWLDRRRLRPLRLVWFGSAGTESPPCGLIDLARLTPELNELHRSVPTELTVISNSRAAFARHLASACFPCRYVEFQTRTFQKILRRQEVCVIPINPNPFTVCKTLNRPALSLLLGLAVVADWIPSYAELSPFIAFGEWAGTLARHVSDPGLRRRQVELGQGYLRARYTPARVVEQWGAALTLVLQTARKAAA